MRDLENLLSPCHCAVLRKASRRISHTYDTALSPSGLKTTQFSLLAAISRTEDAPLTMKELAEAMVMDRSTLGHNLRPLERDGFLEIRLSKSDARSREIILTKKGRRKLSEAAALWRKMQETFVNTVGAAEVARLRESLIALTGAKFPTP
jgi:DNA-binding MarR family transcriptional regulator